MQKKNLVYVNPIVLEIFYQDLCRKALILIIPTVLEILFKKLFTSYKRTNFGKSYSNKNIEPLAPAERLSTVSSPFMVIMTASAMTALAMTSTVGITKSRAFLTNCG